jgi:hypothetical protein
MFCERVDNGMLDKSSRLPKTVIERLTCKPVATCIRIILMSEIEKKNDIPMSIILNTLGSSLRAWQKGSEACVGLSSTAGSQL